MTSVFKQKIEEVAEEKSLAFGQAWELFMDIRETRVRMSAESLTTDELVELDPQAFDAEPVELLEDEDDAE